MLIGCALPRAIIRYRGLDPPATSLWRVCSQSRSCFSASERITALYFDVLVFLFFYSHPHWIREYWNPNARLPRPIPVQGLLEARPNLTSKFTSLPGDTRTPVVRSVADPGGSSKYTSPRPATACLSQASPPPFTHISHPARSV